MYFPLITFTNPNQKDKEEGKSETTGSVRQKGHAEGQSEQIKKNFKKRRGGSYWKC